MQRRNGPGYAKLADEVWHLPLRMLNIRRLVVVNNDCEKSSEEERRGEETFEVVHGQVSKRRGAQVEVEVKGGAAATAPVTRP
jgi:hypothetical protein